MSSGDDARQRGCPPSPAPPAGGADWSVGCAVSCSRERSPSQAGVEVTGGAISVEMARVAMVCVCCSLPRGAYPHPGP